MSREGPANYTDHWHTLKGMHMMHNMTVQLSLLTHLIFYKLNMITTKKITIATLLKKEKQKEKQLKKPRKRPQWCRAKEW